MFPFYKFNNPGTAERRKELRNNMPNAEWILWHKLKGKQLNGFKFRRQYGVGSFIIDFYCPEARLAIEIDGNSHFEDGAKQYDKRRQHFIERFKIKFLRFTNDEVEGHLEDVLDKIINEVKNRI